MSLVSYGYAHRDAIGESNVNRDARIPALHRQAPKRSPQPRWAPDKTEAVARKWAPVFQVPVPTIMSIVDIESAHNPKQVNMARFDKGGAWGLGQQMLDEADEKIKKIRRIYGDKFPQIKAVTKKWHGDPSALLDPDLNLMLTAWQLGRLHNQFEGNFDLVAAAYNQGEYAIKRRLAHGQPAVSKAQPHGMLYVSMAENARKKYVAPAKPVPAMYYSDR
jgi:soluble lytic murein transglycosylase-like protein